MAFWKGICTCIGCAVGVGVCLLTAGAATPAVGAVLTYTGIAGTAGFFIGDKADKEEAEREERLMQNQNYRNAKDGWDKADNQAKTAQNALDVIVGKLNGNISREPHETDEYLKQQFVIYQGQFESARRDKKRWEEEMEKWRKELTGGNSLLKLLGLDKLSFTDKILIAGGIVAVIYLLKG